MCVRERVRRVCGNIWPRMLWAKVERVAVKHSTLAIIHTYILLNPSNHELIRIPPRNEYANIFRILAKKYKLRIYSSISAFGYSLTFTWNYFTLAKYDYHYRGGCGCILSYVFTLVFKYDYERVHSSPTTYTHSHRVYRAKCVCKTLIFKMWWVAYEWCKCTFSKYKSYAWHTKKVWINA